MVGLKLRFLRKVTICKAYCENLLCTQFSHDSFADCAGRRCVFVTLACCASTCSGCRFRLLASWYSSFLCKVRDRFFKVILHCVESRCRSGLRRNEHFAWRYELSKHLRQKTVYPTKRILDPVLPGLAKLNIDFRCDHIASSLNHFSSKLSQLLVYKLSYLRR